MAQKRPNTSKGIGLLCEKQVSVDCHIVIGFSKQSTHSADAFLEHLSHAIIHLETGNQ